MDEEGRPSGIVRAITELGNVYEGNMTPDGMHRGWGVEYLASIPFIKVGWRDDHCQGNFIWLNSKSNAISAMQTGWYEKGDRVGELRDDALLKNFDLKDVFVDFE